MFDPPFPFRGCTYWFSNGALPEKTPNFQVSGPLSFPTISIISWNPPPPDCGTEFRSTSAWSGLRTQELKGETGGGANFEGFISLSVAVRAVSGGRSKEKDVTVFQLLLP